MFSTFFGAKTKTGIRVIKIYDGIRMNDEVISAPPDQTTRTLDDMKAKPRRYAYKVKQTDQLFGVPHIKIAELTEPEHLEEHNIDIIADVTFTYTTLITKPKPNPVFKMLWLITIWSILGAFVLMFMLAKQADRTAIDAQCYYYYLNGEPSSIVIEGEEYKLDKDGKLDPIDEVHFNPWHRQILENNVCTEINIRR